MEGNLREEHECEQKPCPLENDGRFRYLHLPVTGGNCIPETTEDVALSYLKMVDDYMVSKENLLSMLHAFGKQHPEIDINIITPHPEYMEQFLKNV